MPSTHRHLPLPAQSAFGGFRFPADVIVVAVRWYVGGPSLRWSTTRITKTTKPAITRFTVFGVVR
jgi:transposase-like protein